MSRASLVVVGSGIKALAHLTQEVKTYITHADKVLYTINEPVTEEWIIKNAKNAESLDEIYFSYPQRIDAYRAITDYILANLKAEQHICVVMYGHPCFYAKSGLDAVTQALSEGYDARLLPSISSEDCLFADLLIDPATYGCQSYDATDFLVHQHPFNLSAYLILYQVSVIGASGQARFHDNRKNIKILVNHLTMYYPSNHLITLYSAAQYPGLEAKISHMQLSDLCSANISPVETLCIPPLRKAIPNIEMLAQLSTILPN